MTGKRTIVLYWGRYAWVVVGMLMLLMSAGCRTHRKAAHTTFSHSEELRIERVEVEEKLHGDELIVLEEAFEWLDTPYAFGRQDKGKATDCSGMVMVIYDQKIGCKLPRNSAKQAEFCEKIDARHIRPGDLVFFITNGGNKINHVGIMIDTEKFIHASSHGVMVSTMASDYYRKHFQRYGRVPCMKHPKK